MKLIVPLAHMTIEVEAETQKDLYREGAQATEVFGERTCGLCGEADIILAWRTVTQGKKVFEYPEWHCLNQRCGARLSVGCLMEGGGLFPIRKLTKEGKPSREHGTWGAHRGWTKYRGEAPAQANGSGADTAGADSGLADDQGELIDADEAAEVDLLDDTGASEDDFCRDNGRIIDVNYLDKGRFAQARDDLRRRLVEILVRQSSADVKGLCSYFKVGPELALIHPDDLPTAISMLRKKLTGIRQRLPAPGEAR